MFLAGLPSLVSPISSQRARRKASRPAPLTEAVRRGVQILEDHLAGVKGHFGPLNALRFSPDGRSFTSGGEDGYVRLHHFDADYFAMR